MFGRARATPTINPTMNEISINMTMVSIIWHLLPDSPGEPDGTIALHITRRENLKHLKWAALNVYSNMLSLDQFCVLL